MRTIRCCEARTHFSELLDQVAKGKRILITRRGKPAALLSPPPAEPKKDARQVVKEMLEYRDREGPTLGGISVRGAYRRRAALLSHTHGPTSWR